MEGKAGTGAASKVGWMVHYDHHHIFSKRQRKYEIQLFSDGTISSMAKHPLSGRPAENTNVFSHKIRYFFPIENAVLIYRSMIVLCLTLSGLFFINFLLWADQVYESGFTDKALDAVSVAPFLSPLFLMIVFDTLACRIGTPERMTVHTTSTEQLIFRGKLPSQDSVNIARGVTLLGGICGTLLALPDDSFFLLILSLGILGGMFYASWQGILWLLSADKQSDAVQMSCVQFFIAATEIKNGGQDSDPALEKEESEELSQIKKKLGSFENVLQRAEASRDIFSSTSPSLIVIAIGATTERLMYIACDNIGIRRKSNARPTLHTFINEYQTRESLDPKTLMRLQLIRDFRNTATHHFNVDWDDSLMLLRHFCQFVEWFADNHSKEQISTIPINS
jgi:hypothetical protein